MKKVICPIAIFAIMSLPIAASLAAPLGYAGGTYLNDFNGLPTNVTNAAQTVTGRGPHEFTVINAASGMNGWQLSNATGSSSDTEFKSQDGSIAGSTGRGVVSYGTNGSTERALGVLPTSNQISTFGLVLLNTSATTYSGFSLSYTGEQWRRGDVSSAEPLTFAYGTAANIGSVLTISTALSLISPNTQVSPTSVALDGNLPANQALVSGSVTGLSWGPGQTLVLRWSATDQSGQDDGLAIDNLSFTATAVPEPSTMLLLVSGCVLVAGRQGRKWLRSRRAA
jgi:hypothetical protein